MGKRDFKPGSRKVEEFYSTMYERHDIWWRRTWLSKPWTEDPIFREYKFCNVFRQLDKGTVTLTNMMQGPDWLRLWNIVWYRLFNYHGNAKWFESPQDLRVHMTKRWAQGETLFTDAHMTAGRAGEPKFEVMLETAETVCNDAPMLLEEICFYQTMEHAFKVMKRYFAIGAFISYEMVCDFRFLLDWNPTDVLTWANVGPGAKRGMQRLGLDPTIETMRMLLERAPKLECRWPFELREIEHWLCEFDKYCRIQEGAKQMRRFRA